MVILNNTDNWMMTVEAPSSKILFFNYIVFLERREI
jgi:hypothetical protein